MPSTFISKNRDFRVVVVPQRPIFGRDGQAGTEAGKTIEFRNGSYTAMTKDETDALRSAGTFNQEFWEVGNEPGAMHPSVDDMLERITDAATRQNVDKLRDLKTLEMEGDGDQGGHNRHEVLAAVDRALGILTEGKEGKLGPGRPHKPKPHEARKEQTVPDIA